MNPLIFRDIDAYISRLFAPGDNALTETIRALESEGFPPHSISASQGKFLQVMAALCNEQTILEPGTLGGYSTIWRARALPPDGKIISIEVDKRHAALAQKNIERARLSSKVEIRTGRYGNNS